VGILAIQVIVVAGFQDIAAIVDIQVAEYQVTVDIQVIAVIRAAV
jgi:hypothetical protein